MSQEAPFDSGTACLFVLGGRSRLGLPIPASGIRGLRSATLSPDGQWVAYLASSGVTVSDLDGRVIATLADASGCGWSPDGKRLALLFGAWSRDHRNRRSHLGIWHADQNRTDTIEEEAESISWGTGDSLFFGRGGKILAFDFRTGRVSRTGHHGVDVSPDGLYSIAHPPGAGAVIVHDRSSVDLTSMTFAALGSPATNYFAKPFWIPGSGHLLCVSFCGMWPKPDGSVRWECRTGVVDVLTSELLDAWFGVSVGPSADGRWVWIFDGYDTLPKRLDDGASHKAGTSVPSGRTGPEEVHVHLVIRSWAKSVEFGVKRQECSLTMRVGDTIPRNYTYDELVILTDILGARRARFRVAPANYNVKLPGERDPRVLDFFEAGRAPVTLSDQITDGSYIIELSLAPE